MFLYIKEYYNNRRKDNNKQHGIQKQKKICVEAIEIVEPFKEKQ